MNQTIFGTKAPDPRGRVVIAFGGRDYADQGRLFKSLDGTHRRRPISILVEGGADGADSLAGDWAMSRGVRLVKCPANWRGAKGRGEGTERNRFMYDTFRPTDLLRFGGNTGSDHMERYARSQGARVRVVRGRSIGIVEFIGAFHGLSNFDETAVLFEDRLYPSSEHAYAAAKTTDKRVRRAISRAATPGLAKSMGRKVDLRRGWEDMRIDVMREILEVKFALPVPRKLLASTKGLPLVEGNHWNDTFWGVCRGVGENHLGRLLMEIRQ